ncbi:alpha/beta hydrolase family protein [Streptomyces sp. SCA3-4]|uniref:alpha/beta hydrolase n=1 Tax=Streptomyces sichuanensis TaxID=2871810 RepID=UPI001CE346B4|nr:alpha/beta hydrolase [Streptomyces sichuanensis]MCA6091995.1 alpha/beta hydrolase family protein [Streptomyces sichuanensis]
MASRPRSSRLRRTLLAALVAASVAVPVSGMAHPAAVPAPEPTALAPLRSATPAALAARYATTRNDIRAAARTAADHGDRRRAAALRTMAAPGRHFLSFDGRDGGRSAEVVGDLSRAERVAVLVPGSDTGLDRYGRLRSGATALQRELGGRSAVIAWLGYATPATLSPDVLTPGRAGSAAAGLRDFVRELSAAAPAARMSLLCHSYGSVVCARAAPDLPVAAIVLYGSPGTGADHVGQLHTRATVWAGRGTDDWIAEVPHVRLRLPFATVGLGADPVSPGFGARVFDAGTGGHSDYLRPGSVPLRNIARIVADAPHPEEGRRA